jgi:hypothetical protein
MKSPLEQFTFERINQKGCSHRYCLCNHKKLYTYNDTQAGIRYASAGQFQREIALEHFRFYKPVHQQTNCGAYAPGSPVRSETRNYKQISGEHGSLKKSLALN